MNVGPDVAIVGAGPYGLSIAAHLRSTDVTFRIFRRPMQTWREHMPNGMLLKADGFASNLADPASSFTLKSFVNRRAFCLTTTGCPFYWRRSGRTGWPFSAAWYRRWKTRVASDRSESPVGSVCNSAMGSDAMAHRVIL